MYDMNSTFDLDSHLKYKDDVCRFESGLECIILPDGVIEYAMPSHQCYLERYICQTKRIAYQELLDLCPREYYCNYLQWLLNTSGCLSVWETFYMYPIDFYCNEDDLRYVSLKLLIDSGLLKAEVK